MALIKNRSTRIFAFLLIAFFVAGVAGIWLRPTGGFNISLPLRSCLSVPKLADYPVLPADIYLRPSAAVNFSGYKEAESYRSFIRLAADRGVNFAGKYIVAEWGCGTDCQNHAIINAKTGRIISYGLRSAFGVEFFKDSTLITFNPRHGAIKDLYSGAIARTAYYKIANDKLVPVCD